jgi:hypothetical protein
MCCNCNCGSHHGEERLGEAYGFCHTRRFLTKAEKVEKLKSYAEDLSKELAAVEEHIKELES